VRGKVILFNQADTQVAACRITGDASAVDAATVTEGRSPRQSATNPAAQLLVAPPDLPVIRRSFGARRTGGPARSARVAPP
jgi:hypothetical protein